MCIWVLISTFMNNVACILVAASETRVQAWSSVAGAIVNLALTLWLVRTLGSVGVILGTVISYLLLLVGPQFWKVSRILSRNSLLDKSDTVELLQDE
jgi:O-antigen/teichoic acid export membrane protein